MISSCPITLMSQETKYSLTSEYLGCNNNSNSRDQLQNLNIAAQHELQSNRTSSSQLNLNTFFDGHLQFDTRQYHQEPQQPDCQYQEQHQQQQQQTLNCNMINEFSLMHDQQVDLLNQRRIRDKLETRRPESTSRETFNVVGSTSCSKHSPSSSPSSSTCFTACNQVVLGLNSPSDSSVALAQTGQSQLASSSHHTPPDSPITDLCHNLTPSNNPATMTLGNSSDNPGCITISPETHHPSFVTSSNGSHDRRPRVYSVGGQVTSSTRVQLPGSSSDTLLASSSSTSIQEASSTGPFLRVIEQPTNRIRYRYKSEKGSHGGLTGEHNSQSKKTYPTVKLENYKIDHNNVSIMIKASLVTNEENPKPHVHKLMGKNCTPDGTCLIPLSKDFTASFQNLGILFIGKKEVPDILYQRKIKEPRSPFFNEEESITNDSQQLADRLREEAEREAKDMNLNCVKLSFQAFDCTIDPNSCTSNALGQSNTFIQGGISHPSIAQTNFAITNPVFSRPIANQKSPDSGELKIVRMDRNFGCVTGDEEIFVLCEKVNKKEIKVRFFEPDADGNIIWESYGNFSESDVHHQVAIVLRTPTYRDVEIDTLVLVYLQLYRPKDGEYSEPRQFTYYPKSSYAHNPQQFLRSTSFESNKRRKLMSYHSSPILSQHQILTMNQRCPNVNISTLAQSYHHQQHGSITDHQNQSMDTGLLNKSSQLQHSSSSNSSPTMSSIAPFYTHQN